MRTVPLYGKIASGRVALVDDEDFALISQYRWQARKKQRSSRITYYAITSITEQGRQRTLLMHCLIMGQTGIDHRDHDGLNNTRANLRVATASQNTANSLRRADNASGYKGVCWYRRGGKWRAYIAINKQWRHLGYFTSKEDAARAYDAAAIKFYGEFACLNFPESG